MKKIFYTFRAKYSSTVIHDQCEMCDNDFKNISEDPEEITYEIWKKDNVTACSKRCLANLIYERAAK